MVRANTFRLCFSTVCMVLLGFISKVSAEDWPQWMGPTRDGVYAEEGIVDSIPDEGLNVLWRRPINHGYSGPAVVGDRVFVTDYEIASGDIVNSPGGRTKLTGKERVICLDATTGEQIWKHEYDRPYNVSYASGPRATPTIDGGQVFTLGTEGDLICLNAEDGTVVWQRQLREEYYPDGAETPIWGFASHPLVAGDLVYTMAGGEGSAIIALDRNTGDEKWSALSTKDIGYCPPQIHEIQGQEQLVIWHSESINGLDPQNGEVFWSYPLAPRYGMAIAAPQLLGDRLFASGIGEESALFTFENSQPKETLWKGKPKIGVYSANATAIFTKDAIFGSDCGTGQFIAVNPENGERFWESFALTTGGTRRAGHGTAFVVRNHEKYLIFAETGELILASLTPEKFEEFGRMQVLEPTAECFGRTVVWSHPAFANQCMFARNDKEIVCVSLAK